VSETPQNPQPTTPGEDKKSRKWGGLTPKQRRFVKLCARLGNQTRAFELAGYKAKYASQEAHRLARLPLVAQAIRDEVDALVGGAAGLEGRLVAHADARLLPFEPWLRGEKTLAELEEDGVDTSVIKSATINQTANGENRRLELYDAQNAVQLLGKFGGHLVEKRETTHGGQIGVGVDLSRLTESELRRMANTLTDDEAPGVVT